MKHMPVISISGLIDLKLHNTLTLANTRKKCVRVEGGGGSTPIFFSSK